MTDNIKTYFFYTYICGDISWSTIGRESAVVGINEHRIHFFNHPVSGYTNIGTAVSCTVASAAQRRPAETIKERPGGTTAGEVEVDQELEDAILNCQLYELSVGREITPAILQTDILPNVQICPATEKQADCDENFESDPNNNECYLQATPFSYRTRYSIRQHCCYFPNG